MSGAVLVLNSGSSSLKFALFAADRTLSPIKTGTCQGGAAQAGDLLAAVIDFARDYTLAGIGHRVVHGGPDRFSPERVTPEVVDALERAVPLASIHLPPAIALIKEVERQFPAVPQVACYDTGFHRDLPEVASRLPIPRAYDAMGVRRYGFHGLSYAYVMEELRQTDPLLARGSLVVAHLGNGSSAAAIRDGRSVDTSMSLTPLGGAMMSTRSGDLDPGLVAFLVRREALSADGIDDLLGRRSGLLAVSGATADMRELLEREGHEPHSRLAVDMYAYQYRKQIGAYAAALGGIDGLIFTGGIGQHAAAVRARICAGLEFLGIALDEERNRQNLRVISAAGARVAVNVIATNEELMIARATIDVLRISHARND